MKRVRMRHPDPELNAVITPFESQVPHLAASGWELVPEDEQEPKKTPKPSRTRTTKESD